MRSYEPLPRRLASTLALGLCAVVPLALGADAQAQQVPQNGAVAFSAVRGGVRVVYAKQPNGRTVQLLPGAGPADHPAFSARGARLMFTRRGSLGAQIWIS